MAVARFGLDSFKPFLPDVILGKDTNIAYYIGGDKPPTQAHDPRRPDQSVTVTEHSISLEVGNIGNKMLLVARIRLFISSGSPSYTVVVGEPSQSILGFSRRYSCTTALTQSR
jgi:hypothetical protein